MSNPNVVRATVAGNVVSLIFSEDVVLTAADGLNGWSLFLNPSLDSSLGWTSLSIPSTSLSLLADKRTLNLTSPETLNEADTILVRYDPPGSGVLKSVAGGSSLQRGEIWIAGTGNDTLNMDDYGSWLPVSVFGRSGDDSLIGSGAADRLIDGGGADTLQGGLGADQIVLVEDGSAALPFSRDIVVMLAGDSTGSFTIGQSNSPDVIEGFDVLSSNTIKHDVLDLPHLLIATDGVDLIGNRSAQSLIDHHSVAGGMFTFFDKTGKSILANQANATQVASYVQGVKGTGAFLFDSDANGVADSTAVFQTLNAEAKSTAVMLKGVLAAGISTTDGANNVPKIVQIQDQQPLDPLAIHLDSSSSGTVLSVNFEEPVFANSSVALTLMKNGTEQLAITAFEGSGTTQLRAVSLTVLNATDYVTVSYQPSPSLLDGSDAIRDASGNRLPSLPGTIAFGTELANTIALSSGVRGVEAGGGNDSVTGSADSDWISGGSGDDSLFGAGGDDDIEGGTGNDSIEGGEGADYLSGDAGEDRFRYINATDLNQDVIGGANGASDLVSARDRMQLFGGTTTGDIVYDLNKAAQIREIDRIDLADRLNTGSTGIIGVVLTSNMAATADYDRNGTTGDVGTVGYKSSDSTRAATQSFKIDGSALLAGQSLVVQGQDGSGSSGTSAFGGMQGNDLLIGGAGWDNINAGAGNDTLVGGLGSNVLAGGSGNDLVVLSGARTDWTFTPDMEDSVNGGVWAEYWQGRPAFTATGSSVAGGLAGNDSVSGSVSGSVGGTTSANAGSANLTSPSGAVAATVLLSRDYLTGIEKVRFGTLAAGSEFELSTLVTQSPGTAITYADSTNGAYGTINADILRGSANNDNLRGQDGNDLLVGADGNDWLEGGKGNDTLDGGAGRDVAAYEDSPTPVTIDLQNGFAHGGLGSDVLVSVEAAHGSAHGDTIVMRNPDAGSTSGGYVFGRAGNDHITGGTGDDNVTPGSGKDTIMGGPGYDSVNYQDDGYNFYGDKSKTTTGVVVNLAEGWAIDNWGDRDTLSSISSVQGSDYGDLLIGGAVENGVKTKATYDGFESFRGNGGDDTIDGGAGFDRADYNNSPVAVTVNLGGTFDGRASDGFGGRDVLRNIEEVRGSIYNDTLTGSDNASFESFVGEKGNDLIDGRGGWDRANYQFSSTGVVVNLSANTASRDGVLISDSGTSAVYGVDTLYNIEEVRGSESADSLTGDALANTLEGRGGDDTLIGGDGADKLYGGSGNDTLDGGIQAIRPDTANANNDYDWAIYDSESSPVLVKLGSDGTAGTAQGLTIGVDRLINIERVVGTKFGDMIYGSDRAVNEVLRGNGGDDTLSGGTGTGTDLGLNLVD